VEQEQLVHDGAQTKSDEWNTKLFRSPEKKQSGKLVKEKNQC